MNNFHKLLSDSIDIQIQSFEENWDFAMNRNRRVYSGIIKKYIEKCVEGGMTIDEPIELPSIHATDLYPIPTIKQLKDTTKSEIVRMANVKIYSDEFYEKLKQDRENNPICKLQPIHSFDLFPPMEYQPILENYS